MIESERRENETKKLRVEEERARELERKKERERDKKRMRKLGEEKTTHETGQA